MPYSDVQICNLALSRIGSSTLIEDLTEASAEGRACNLLYVPSRDYVLSRHQWPFATRYVALGQVAIAPNDDWGFSYRYPSDCVLAMRLVLAPGRIYGNNPPYEISGDSAGTLILCDLDTATLEYVAAQSNPGFFGDAMASAIAWRLASELAIPLSRTADYRATAIREFEKELSIAKAAASNQEQRDAMPASSFELARTSSGYSGWPTSYGPTR